jgi:MFS family permease
VDTYNREAGGQDDQPSFRFYVGSHCRTLTCCASWLDGGTISTALPTIAKELDLGPACVWVANGYFLMMAAFQPLFSQSSDLWVGVGFSSRLWHYLCWVPSELIAGPNTGAMLIAGRSIQSVGAGGINMMADLVTCDLVPWVSYLALVYLSRPWGR